MIVCYCTAHNGRVNTLNKETVWEVIESLGTMRLAEGDHLILMSVELNPAEGRDMLLILINYMYRKSPPATNIALDLKIK